MCEPWPRPVAVTGFRNDADMTTGAFKLLQGVGSALDYQIHELVENLDRRELTDEQRRDLRDRLKALQRGRLATVARRLVATNTRNVGWVSPKPLPGDRRNLAEIRNPARFLANRIVAPPCM